MHVAVVLNCILALAVSKGKSCYPSYLLANFVYALFLWLHASCRYTPDVGSCLQNKANHGTLTVQICKYVRWHTNRHRWDATGRKCHSYTSNQKEEVGGKIRPGNSGYITGREVDRHINGGECGRNEEGKDKNFSLSTWRLQFCISLLSPPK